MPFRSNRLNFGPRHDDGPGGTSVTTAKGSSLDRRQIDPVEALGIREDVHLDDLPTRNGEADHGEQPSVRKAAHEADVAIHQDHLIGQGELRGRRGLSQDDLSPTHEARQDLHRSAVSPQHDVRFEHGGSTYSFHAADQHFEIAVLNGREKCVDDESVAHGEDISATPVRVGKRDRDGHLTVHRGTCSLELHQFGNLLVEHRIHETAVSLPFRLARGR